ncbi:hypothetical protein Acr_15g0013110 [Actinidia rufa]|uniref:Uncharacterized protein n=1 Tax=Actinidia rufa TaxID=165716 RepID=A0A7J0FVH7_9ERIC|nr:hypothetical protein Acr_08g0005120 [Actinidia rufa]GFZ02703.1 hypothetical protein Acr_15g0013110 [Actinidia rufa]
MNNFHLLITSVWSLIKIAEDARLTCTRDELFLQASNAEHRVAALLEIPRSSFGGFPACPGTYVDGVDLYDLQMTLSPSHQENTMYFWFNLDQRLLRFAFLGQCSVLVP